MKAFFLSTVLCFALSQGMAQKVNLISVDQLNQRLSRGKDTVYVVNFWATWCVPCRKELPRFEQVQSNLNTVPFKVLLISLDFKSQIESSLKPFIRRMKIKSEVFVINEKNQQQFINKIDSKWSGAIPATLIVNTARHRRKFITKELTCPELLNLYNLNK